MKRERKPQRLSAREESALHQEVLRLMDEQYENQRAWIETKAWVNEQGRRRLEQRLSQLCSEWGRPL